VLRLSEWVRLTLALSLAGIIPLKGALESKLVQVHVFGKPASGDLKRPWKAAGLMQGMQGGEPKSDKKSIEEAEKSGRGGVKEE
jgi:hypothetical protein